MLRHHLRLALRLLRRGTGFTLITLLSLTIGLACALTIGRYVLHELRYDRFHADADRIVRIARSNVNADGLRQYANTPAALGPTLEAEFPTVERSVRVTLPRDVLVIHDDTRMYEERVFWVDSTFFDLFDFRLLRGEPTRALAEPYTIVLTPSAARRYFGDADPIGQSLTLRGWAEQTYRVTGLIEPAPAASHLQFEMLASMAGEPTLYPWMFAGEGQWSNSLVYTYVRLTDPGARATLQEALPAFAERHLGEFGRDRGFRPGYRAQPLQDLHLRSGLAMELPSTGDLRIVGLFAGIAVLILLIACVNFVNLATARATRRSREVGVRKALGADRHALVRQFLAEALLLAGAAVVPAVLLAEWMLPVLRAQTQSTVPGLPYDAPLFWVVLLALGLATGLLAGGYPAFVLARFSPVRALRGSLTSGPGRSRLREGLVVFQFGVAVALIACTLLIHRQLTFLAERDLGFDAEQVVLLPFDASGALPALGRIKAELLRHPDVLGVSAAAGVPGRTGLIDNWSVSAVDEPALDRIPMTIAGVDHDYIDVLDLDLLAGRALDPARAADSTAAFLINETGARRLGWADPVGHRLTTHINDGRTGTIVGLVRDFHLRSLHQPVEPMLLQIWPDRYRMLAVRVRAGGAAEAIAHFEAIWPTMTPDEPFQYTFLDDAFGRHYAGERRLSRLFGGFTALALLIAALGLLGLASFMAERRTREIGIRRVLGASVTGLVALLTRDFLRLVVAGILVATPVAWFVMRRWLGGFAYRTTITPSLFVAAGALALALAALTVIAQVWRAASADPVRTLRTE